MALSHLVWELNPLKLCIETRRVICFIDHCRLKYNQNHKEASAKFASRHPRSFRCSLGDCFWSLVPFSALIIAAAAAADGVREGVSRLATAPFTEGSITYPCISARRKLRLVRKRKYAFHTPEGSGTTQT